MDEKEAEAELVAKGKLVSECLLNNSMFTIVGVAAGTVIGIRRKGFRPLVEYSLIGTMGDLYYGYRFKCVDVIEDVRLSREKFDQDKLARAKAETYSGGDASPPDFAGEGRNM